MTRKSPVVDGVTTTYAVLAKALGLTRAGAQHRYNQAVKVHGANKVKSEHLVAPVVDPAAAMASRIKQAQREKDKIYRFALMHGPTHAALEFKMDYESVVEILNDRARTD